MNPEMQHPGAAAVRQPVILAVDDDPINLAVVRDCLLDSNYTILVAEDGESAVQRAAYAQPDLILLDIMMPAGDGFSVVEKLRLSTNTFHIPIVFISALPKEDLELRATRAGVAHYFSKPFDINAIVYYIKNELYVKEYRAHAVG
jgi:CheY-like chemotaxis protein